MGSGITEIGGAALAVVGTMNLSALLGSIAVSRPFRRVETLGTTAGTPPSLSTMGDLPFVSVHVAIHDEPADMVIATLDALRRSVYPAFEVVVIDNNTADRAVWEPVAAHALALGPEVRFFHYDGVRGAKAGALNIALELADPRATYVAIVDADYQVAPDFLAQGVAACGPDVQFVQFPQAYREAAGATAVVAELSDYFETFPRAANRTQSPLLSGTLSVISIAALRAVGGWPTRSITEDAELGVRLWSMQARGLFLPGIVGQGLLPVDLAGLRLQRQRWVSGNMQTLLGARSAILSNGGVGGSLLVIAQLTAWLGLLALPLISLVLAMMVRVIHGNLPIKAWAWVEAIAVTTILCALAHHALRALTRQQGGSLAVTMSLLWTSSFGWLSALGPRPLRFRRTPKAVGGKGRTGGLSLDTLASLVALVTAGAFALEGVPLAVMALTLSATGLVTGPLIDRSLRRAARAREPMPRCRA